MGAYLAWHPNARVRTLIFFGFITYVQIKAKWLLLVWFALQFLDAFNPNSGVAWGAHVGGFAFGLGIALLVVAMSGGRRRAWRATS
jgi:membrane associated rhomboid family serine protease